MALVSQTRPSTPRLSEAARHLVLPSGIVSTGWPAVEAECSKLGIEFDAWQDGAGKVVFAKRADGSYAATIGGVVISIPRQVGKTFFIGAIIFALCLLNPGLLVIWTAHQLATAGETFRSMQGLARKPKIAPYVKRVLLGSGDEAIEFMNGSRILFGARERGFGLGFTKVGVLVMDEAQRLTEKTMDDLVPTTNQSVNPLIFLIGTPPRPTDAGEVFKSRRREALSGDSDDMVYLEFSADPDVNPASWAPKYVDWAAVAKANASYPKRTPRTAILRMLKNLGPESFRREGLGVWDDDQAGSRLISADLWRKRGVDEAPTGVASYGVAFSQDGSRVSLGGARKHAGGVHVELIDAQTGPVELGIGSLADWLAASWRTAAVIVISGAAGAKVLKQALRDRGVPESVIHVASTPDYTTACAMAWEAVKDGSLTHLDSEGQAVLDGSVAVCDMKKRSASGAWGWEATTPTGDETPIESVSLALFGARTSKRVPGRKAVIL